ncbi:MAG: 50S ribosomal protein L9 [Nitrosomonas sp.]|nr:50S ribosomal protein L9 [Nitrosomonas sp.]
MQVILMEKIAKLGALGSIVNVKRGFARNYLIPQGKAKWATERAIAEFESRRAELEKKQTEILSDAELQAARLEGLVIQLTQKAGIDGKLFGSVTSLHIAEALRNQDFLVEKSMVHIPSGQLKQTGDYPIVVALHSDVSAQITISILAEKTV